MLNLSTTNFLDGSNLTKNELGLENHQYKPLSVNLEKNQNAGPSPGATFEKNPERGIALFAYVSVLCIFFPRSVFGDGPKNSQIRVNVIVDKKW